MLPPNAPSGLLSAVESLGKMPPRLQVAVRFRRLRDQFVGRYGQERHELARQRQLPEQLLGLGEAPAIEVLGADLLLHAQHFLMHRALEIGTRDLDAAFKLGAVFEPLPDLRA